MVPYACTLGKVPLRFPPELQTEGDTSDLLDDESMSVLPLSIQLRPYTRTRRGFGGTVYQLLHSRRRNTTRNSGRHF